MKKFIIVFVAMLFGVMLNAQNKINVYDFIAETDYMIPMHYDPRPVATSTGVRVHNDSVKVYLPYIGDAYSSIVDSDGLNFEEPVQMGEYYSRNDKKKFSEFKFSTKHNSMFYDFIVRAFDDGRIDLTVQPWNQDSVAYLGSWRNIPAKQ